MAPLPHAGAPAAEALTLLDALARAPAAAALVVAALEQADRKALRLAHTQLRDAVGEATTKIDADQRVAATPAEHIAHRQYPPSARPPTPRRWPRLEALHISGFELAALEALGAETWSVLRTLRLSGPRQALDAPSAARTLATALRRMPALRELKAARAQLSDAAAGELFRVFAAAAPHLRALSFTHTRLSPSWARGLGATGWRLEALDLAYSRGLGAAGLEALLAAPAFAVRRLSLVACGLEEFALPAIAAAPWPLEELDLSDNDLGDADGPALAALARHRGLRKLDVGLCDLTAAGFKALVEAAWPALTYFDAREAKAADEGPHALGPAAFAGFPVLEELDLTDVVLGDAGAALLASRRWLRLRELYLNQASIGAAGLKALVEACWPALTHFGVRSMHDGPHALGAAAFAGFPALQALWLLGVHLGEAGAALLASRRWARLELLDFDSCGLGDAGLAALARGEFPALKALTLRDNQLSAPVPLEAARRWAPALEELSQREAESTDDGASDEEEAGSDAGGDESE